jgi:catechol 2,3-dioxygenase-like lactoylglutathione lyase family enzyme
MDQAQVESKRYQIPPREGITVTYALMVADLERSVAFYEDVLGGRVVRKGQPTIIELANAWVLVDTGGPPTDDKPTVTLQPPTDLNEVSTFMNIRVVDMRACYDEWRKRGAQFLTEPKEQESEIRCYIRDPDGHLIEVGQSKAPR